jgi:hypothetical protein
MCCAWRYVWFVPRASRSQHARMLDELPIEIQVATCPQHTAGYPAVRASRPRACPACGGGTNRLCTHHVACRPCLPLVELCDARAPLPAELFCPRGPRHRLPAQVWFARGGMCASDSPCCTQVWAEARTALSARLQVLQAEANGIRHGYERRGGCVLTGQPSLPVAQHGWSYDLVSGWQCAANHALEPVMGANDLVPTAFPRLLRRSVVTLGPMAGEEEVVPLRLVAAPLRGLLLHVSLRPRCTVAERGKKCGCVVERLTPALLPRALGGVASSRCCARLLRTGQGNDDARSGFRAFCKLRPAIRCGRAETSTSRNERAASLRMAPCVSHGGSEGGGGPGGEPGRAASLPQGPSTSIRTAGPPGSSQRRSCLRPPDIRAEERGRGPRE